MFFLLRVGDLRAYPRSAVIGLLAAAAGYAVACAGLRRVWRRAPGARRALTLVIVVVAVMLRLVAFALPPTLSDDVYRYRWDGRVQAAGVNPYLYPPAALELEALRDEAWNGINYPRIRTIYPPLAQLLFAATYRVADTVTAFRAAALLGDLLCLLALAAALRAMSLPGWMLALYGWHPLPPVEFASSGHFDAWVMAVVVAAVWAHRRERPVVSTVALGLGVLLKTWPLVLVPFLLRRRPRWHWALFGVTLAVGFAPYFDAGSAMLHPWLEYAGRWRFNDAAFYLLAGATGSLAAAKGIAAAVGAALFGWLWHREVEPLAGAYWTLLAFVLLMPTIHPWYLLWALPLAVLAGDAAWMALCALAPAAYWILVGAGGDSDVWVEPAWPRLLEYLPSLLLWVALAARFGAPAPGRTTPLVGEPERRRGVGGRDVE